MTADTPRSRPRSRAAAVAGLAVLLALSGCKSKDGGGGGLFGGTSRPRVRDPLVHDIRIPPQDVPLPDKGAVGAKGKGDPLTTPVGKADKSGAGYSDDPGRFKGQYVPGPGSTPAALAASGRDGDGLRIDDREDRVPLRPAGGGVRPAGNFEAAAEGLEPLYAELKRVGDARWDRGPVPEDGKFVFRASVQNKTGGRTLYQGREDTAAAAVRQVLDQILADQK